MQSKTAIGFLLAVCVASCHAICQLEAGGTAESYTCEAIDGLQALSTIPATAQRITIFNSELPSLPARAFARFGSTLVYLNITHCGVEDILPGTFAGLTFLRDLVLDNNHIETVKANWIEGLVNLKTLRLWHNRITNIEPQVFDHLPNLELLDIAYNKIDYCLSTEHLAKLTQLKYLYITENPWPQRCRPPVFFHLENHHVRVVNTWGNTHIIIEECLAHELHAQYNDEILQRCVERLTPKFHGQQHSIPHNTPSTIPHNSQSNVHQTPTASVPRGPILAVTRH